jgi:phosphate transport system substrate-binding protein
MSRTDLRSGARFLTAAVIGSGWLLAACGDGGVEPPDGAVDAADDDAGLPDTGPPDTGPPDTARPDTGPPPVRPPVTIDTYPSVDGSTSNLPLARLIACELLGLSYRWQPGMGSEGEAEIVPVATTPEEEVLAARIMEKIVHNRTHAAYTRLVDGEADLILVANPPSPDERAYAEAAGVTLVAEPIALDALVIIVNAENGVSALTTSQIRSIFMGEITTWNEVGGAPEEIHPYVRPENSGSQQLMNEIVMGGLTMPAWPPDRTIGFMGALIDAVRADPLAIGYSVYYWVTYQYPSGGYRVLTVDGVAPTAATIDARAYPFNAPVLMVTRADLDPASLAGQMREWLLTPDGQEVVGRSGYVPYAP